MLPPLKAIEFPPAVFAIRPHLKKKRDNKFLDHATYEPQIYFYVFWQVLSVLFPYDVVFTAVWNSLDRPFN